ncbi:hypothetical protein IKQ21_01790 [bacterium]|nr:hypothetical protein [bacterium]
MIKPISSTPIFKGVYLSSGNFTQKQYVAVNDILRSFSQKDLSMKNGLSYEQNYENKGIDFVIKPAADGYSVYLTKTRQLREYNPDKYKRIPDFCADSMVVGKGKYDGINKIFDIDDIESSAWNFRLSPEAKLISLLAIVAAFVSVPIINKFFKIGSNNVKISGTEMVDSIKKSSDSIKNDTFKIVNNLK